MVQTRKVISWLLVVGVLLTVGWAFWQVVRDATKQQVTVQLNKTTLRAEVARTESELQRGLSGRQDLPVGRAMLFLFDKDKRWEIWMKDMRFAIDIIWLDQYQKVVHIEHAVQPDAEPHRVYRPPQPARYVLEVRAGVAKQLRAAVGQQASFELEQAT